MQTAHTIATWLHIISAIYWLGAIMFILTALGPVLRNQPSIVVPPIMSGIHERVRRFVLIAIIVFTTTGAFNMYYRGLFNASLLLGSSYGLTFLLKMVPVALMFTLYFLAPTLMKKFESKEDDGECADGASCCEMEEGHKPANRVFAMLHIAALVSGFVAVLLGVQLRG